ncbi:hypothetical protein MVAC_13216 [Mycolicibacterium vaccae ATCC 25954]|uniref:Uncharacterized protein n=1 Tax=Mycolicibacterium vaccae ATCC 25954 TaxID=1194972 RepID=K0VDL4_MYCVA|nr:hypothetical protein MYVA_3492 [Mycolicibacterium vaccae 95051]EJZ09194.1 hypothetical protein MVAC_13216 [Mycolicibacterium vaccae ATCC 25954]
MAALSGTHSDLGPELRQLAQSILDKLDPAVRLAAARAQSAAGGPGRCQQVWCPVCALAALISGEQHPLLNVVAEHSVALLTLLKAMLEDIESSGGGTPPTPEGPPPDEPGPPDPDGPPPPEPPGRYQHIPVSVEE